VKAVDRFVGATLTGVLLVFGVATCVAIMGAFDVELMNRLLFRGLLDFTPSSEPIIRHWGLMIFGVGALMIASAFRPWLQFSTIAFATAEKAFIVWLYLSVRDQPWGQAYLVSCLVDGTFALYGALYFLSSHGRPHQWVRSGGEP
jgi:hypothetical protein